MALVCGSREYRIIVEKNSEISDQFYQFQNVFLYVMFVVMAVLLFQRIFTLQIVQGEDKAAEFESKNKKERSIASTRGNIYDVNGVALAYNELSSSVTIEDVYESSKKNATINGILKKVLHILDENGDSISCDFNIYIDGDGEFAYSVTGSRRLRFIADVYGITQISDLEERQKMQPRRILSNISPAPNVTRSAD